MLCARRVERVGWKNAGHPLIRPDPEISRCIVIPWFAHKKLAAHFLIPHVLLPGGYRLTEHFPLELRLTWKFPYVNIDSPCRESSRCLHPMATSLVFDPLVAADQVRSLLKRREQDHSS